MSYEPLDSKIRKTSTPGEAFIKISRYCAFQERSHHEVRNKLYEYGLHRDDVEELITKLITEKFLNEERFAKAFAGGKFRIKKWGRNKIQHKLEGHKITTLCIQKALDEIDERDYTKTLKDLLNKKFLISDESNLFKKRDKVAKYAIGKGFEPDLVWKILKGLTEM